MDKFTPLKTPIAFIIFNRPDTTRKVFEAIRQAEPRQLLVIADGPRDGHEGEAERCARTRQIIDEVDWECEVLTNFADQNLGCKKRVSSGLDWVFEEVEEAIILEDDCLPDPSFFRYCEQLLDRYANDTRIMSITGTNFHPQESHSQYSYCFSRYEACWGWASWKRAWQYFDVDLKLWPEVREQQLLEHLFESKELAEYWRSIFGRLYRKEIDTWAYAWTFAHFVQRGLAIVPEYNLISNIGFGAHATHTQTSDHDAAAMGTHSLEFPLRHPTLMISDPAIDSAREASLLAKPSLPTRVLRRFRREAHKVLDGLGGGRSKYQR